MSWLRALGVLVVVVAAACQGGGGPAEHAPVAEPSAAAGFACAPASLGPVTDGLILRGVIAPPPSADVIVGSVVSGRITVLPFEVGDTVTAGEVVARLDDPSLAAGVRAGQAERAAAQAALNVARSTRVRQEELARQSLISKSALEDARAGEASARANLDAARAREGGASGQVARAELRSPVSGVVLRIFHRAGEVVDGTTATPILEIADVRTLEVRVQATSAELARLRPALVAHVVLDAAPDAELAARVRWISPLIDPATGLGEVRLELTLPATGPRPLVGATATVQIDAATRQVVTVPETALRRSLAGDDEVVQCAGTPPVAAVRGVRVGKRQGGRIEIVEGLAAGDLVVVDRALGLENGVPLGAPP